MHPDEIIAECRALAEDLDLTSVRRWKAEHPGRLIIGCFPVYIPQELVHALGGLPVGVMGADLRVETDRADSRIQSFICSISRSTLELGLTGRLDVLDGMLFGSICDVARNLAGLWRRNFPGTIVDYIHFPQNITSAAAVAYYRQELARVLEHLAERAGVTVTDDDLRASIAAFNAQRAGLRALYDVKRETPWLLTLHDAYVVARAGTLLPVEQHTALLNDLLARLPERSARRRDNIRVVIEGAFCEQMPLELIEVIEEAGAYVVDDDILVGQRWFLDDVPTAGDPLIALAERYLTGTTYSSVKHDGATPREDLLLERCRRAKADGILFASAKFCEPALYDYVIFKGAVESARIPYMAFEFEEKMGSFETVRTQVETFVESILFFSEEAA